VVVVVMVEVEKAMETAEEGGQVELAAMAVAACSCTLRW